MSLNFIKITLRYEGQCFVCKAMMMPDEIALWKHGVGIKHEKCVSGSFYGDKWSEKNPFENTNKHSDRFYEMKELMESIT